MECRLSTLSPGDALHGARYRLLKQLNTPSSQQGQRADWQASDAQSPDSTVLLHQLSFPLSASSEEQQTTIQTITQDLTELAGHPGFLPVIDVFQERGEYYIVQPYPEGESLASLLKQHGGTLPESEIAEYGLQLCTMLSRLTQSHLPSVNGFLSPETILISPDKRQVWLLSFPFFSSQTSQQEVEDSPSSALFSLAATLHHALTGYDPDENPASSYPPARRLNPAVTPQMEALLARAFHSSPSQRLTDPVQMQQELSKLIASSPSSSTASTSFPVEKEQKHEKGHQARRRNLWSPVGLSTAILLLLLVTLYPLLTSHFASPAPNAVQQALSQKALTNELNLELQAYRTKGIGVSDGRLAFDIYPGRTKADIDLKQQAASTLQQGNTSSALNLLTQAVAADPADGEAQIYKENLHILLSSSPYITIALGLSINKNDAYLVANRPNLESAFLAQHEINTKGLLPHGLQLRLLIGNPGEEDGVAMVTQFIANRVVKAGNLDHIVAFVGWPASRENIDARDILTAAHIPFVSQFAASVNLSGSTPYFFRVNPADDQQGMTLGDIAMHQLHATNVLVLQDTADPASVSLAKNFSSRLRLNHVTVLNAFFTKFETPVEMYEQIISAMSKQVDLIFLAGFNSDGVRLAHALGEVSRANPTKTFLANLKILGGAALDSELLLGKGHGPDATLAASYPQDMQRLLFMAFAHPDEWTFLRVPQKQQPDFFARWSALYQHALPPAENALAPQNESILTYDAVRVIAHAVRFVSGPPTGQSVRAALASLGHKNIPAYQGVSGRISFDAQGNPIDKAQVILDIEQRNGQNMIVLHQIAGTFF